MRAARPGCRCRCSSSAVSARNAGSGAPMAAWSAVTIPFRSATSGVARLRCRASVRWPGRAARSRRATPRTCPVPAVSAQAGPLAGVAPVGLPDLEDPGVRCGAAGRSRPARPASRRPSRGAGCCAPRPADWRPARAMRSAGSYPVRVEVSRPDEGVGEDLVQAEPGQDAPDAMSRLARIRPERRQRGLRLAGRDPAVAVAARDLLGDVLRRHHVQAMLGHGDVQPPLARRRHREPQRRQELRDRRRGRAAGRAGAPSVAARPSPHVAVAAPGRCRRSPRHPGAGDLRDQPRRAVRGEPRQVVPDPLLVAQAGLGAEPEPARRVPDRRPMEDGRLEDDPGRRVADLGARPAHDPGQADGSRLDRR